MSRRVNKKTLTLALVGTFTLSGCQTVQQLYTDHKGLIAGCAIGALTGALAKGEKGAVLGLIAGCGVGAYYDHQRKKLKDFAKEQEMDLAIEEVEVTVLDTDGKSNSDVKLLSSSFVDEVPLFNSGSAELSRKAKNLVLNLAKTYKENGSVVMIVGHSDSSGSATYNKSLSERRALSVAKLLKKQGVPRENIYYQGAGESQPIVSNDTADGRQLNRRVEFVEVGAASVLKNSDSEVKKLPKEVIDRSFVQYAEKQKSKLRNIAFKEKSAKTFVVPAVKGKSTKISAAPAVLDFNGNSINEGSNPLASLLGEPEKPAFEFSLFQKAYADENYNIHYSCAESEPAITGQVKSLGGKVEFSSSDYVPGMNGSPWGKEVNGHLVAMKNLFVAKNGYKPANNPELLIWKNFKGGDSMPSYTLKTKVAETYVGDKNFLYRVYFSPEKTSPINCMDIILPKNSGSFSAKAGLIYYSDNNVFKAAEYQPKKL